MSIPPEAWIALRGYVPPPGVLYSIEEFPTEGRITVNLYSGEGRINIAITQWKGQVTLGWIDANAESLLARECTCSPEPKRKHGTIRAMDLQPSIN